MLNNKADTIEDYILQQLSKQQDGQVELKRTELADKISCAPSQISYVLSTRFTHDRGFIVESRRGMGGYIRITIVTDTALEKKLLYRDMLEKIKEGTPFEMIKSMLDFLLENKFITRREAELVAQFSANLYQSEEEGNIKAEERAKLVRSIFLTLSKIT